ncbi:hypothetical protein H4R99_005241, partial [Coemansia sp. RSA 1722]
AREPLVSLTVSVLSNLTSEASRNSFQATFDRSDYTYPLPQTGLSAFGFAGELYVPEDATCADEVVGANVRQYAKPEHSNGIAFLPYRSCRSQWEWILHQETRAGRAAGALLYSMKDNAAQAAERAIVDLAYLHTPVWVVNAVTGQYLIRVMEQVYANKSSLGLPAPPNSVEYQHLQDDVRLAVRSATEGTKIQTPRFHRRRLRRSRGDPWTRNTSVEAELDNRGMVAEAGADPRWISGRQRAATQRIRQLHGQGRASSREKRVLRQHELDAMPCKVISAYDLKPTTSDSSSSAKFAVTVPPAPYYGWRLRPSMSCPHLVRTISRHSAEPSDANAEHLDTPPRVYSFQNTSSIQDMGKPLGRGAFDAGSDIKRNDEVATDGGWDSIDPLECAICLDEIHIGDVIRILPCPHLFHSDCIDRWLLYQSSFCPLCKRDTLFDPTVSKSSAQLAVDTG